jgi:hypothetical protein
MQSLLLPELQLALLERCVLHETIDPQRVSRLAARIASDDVLRSPLIVAPYVEHNYLLVLDGATRTTALRQLGYQTAPVQIVNYADEQVKLHSWVHLLQQMSAPTLMQTLHQIDGLVVEPTDPEMIQRALHEQTLHCVVVDNSGNAWAVGGGKSLADRARLLNAIFDCYVGRTTVQRLPDDEPLTVDDLPEGTAAIFFAPITKQELLELTSAGEVVPAGITRHIIPGRVLQLDVPLAALRHGSWEAQRSWFQDWVAARIAAGKARLYVEPTWLFSE